MGVYVFEPEVGSFIDGPRSRDFPDLVKGLLAAKKPWAPINSADTGWISAATRTITGLARNLLKKKSEFFI